MDSLFCSSIMPVAVFVSTPTLNEMFPVPDQLIRPAFTIGRPPMVFTRVPEMDSVADSATLKAPSPPIVPPVQTNVPLTLRPPSPDRVPFPHPRTPDPSTELCAAKVSELAATLLVRR